MSTGTFHGFDIAIACEFGQEEAVVIQNFQHWIRRNRAKRRHLHEGRTWCYYSVAELERIWPYWSGKQIRRIVGSVVQQGVLLKGSHSSAYGRGEDRSTWFAFRDEARFLGPETTKDGGPSPCDTPDERSNDSAPDRSGKWHSPERGANAPIPQTVTAFAHSVQSCKEHDTDSDTVPPTPSFSALGGSLGVQSCSSPRFAAAASSYIYRIAARSFPSPDKRAFPSIYKKEQQQQNVTPLPDVTTSETANVSLAVESTEHEQASLGGLGERQISRQAVPRGDAGGTSIEAVGTGAVEPAAVCGGSAGGDAGGRAAGAGGDAVVGGRDETELVGGRPGSATGAIADSGDALDRTRVEPIPDVISAGVAHCAGSGEHASESAPAPVAVEAVRTDAELQATYETLMYGRSKEESDAKKAARRLEHVDGSDAAGAGAGAPAVAPAVVVAVTADEEHVGAAGLLEAWANGAISARDAWDLTQDATMARVLEVTGRAEERPAGMRCGFVVKMLRDGLSVTPRASPPAVEHRTPKPPVAVENGVVAGEVSVPPVPRDERPSSRSEEERAAMDALKAHLKALMTPAELALLAARKQQREAFGRPVPDAPVEGLTPLKLIVQEVASEHEPRDHLVLRRAA